MPTGPSTSGDPSAQRAELLARLETAGRESSAATVMFHAAVGAKQGLSSVEEKALDVLLREGPLTHAELGAQTALAAPSVTDLIDRLVRKGYVRRERHPDDGRRVLVHAEAEKIFAEVAPLFTDWVTQLHALYETYTDEQLATIADFMSKAAVLQRAAAERLASSD